MLSRWNAPVAFELAIEASDIHIDRALSFVHVSDSVTYFRDGPWWTLLYFNQWMDSGYWRSDNGVPSCIV